MKKVNCPRCGYDGIHLKTIGDEYHQYHSSREDCLFYNDLPFGVHFENAVVVDNILYKKEELE